MGGPKTRGRLGLLVGAIALVAGLAVATGPASASSSNVPATSGAPDLLSTPGGVVWSWGPASSYGEVFRSTDDGAHWHTVLGVPPTSNGFGLTASYFLGPQDAWLVKQNLHGDGIGETTTVYSTSDGGAHWYHSKALPGDVSTCCLILFDQVYFANAQDGWVLASGQNMIPGAPTTLTMLWWRSTDGGRSWQQLPAADLPFQGHDMGPLSAYLACPSVNSPHLTFATVDVGWFSEGACGAGGAHPQVWLTTDGGTDWTAASLPAPAGGWGDWFRTDQGGVDVGSPRYFGSSAQATVLVPVALGKSSLVVERSSDGGRAWAIANQLELGLTPQSATPAEWFDALSPSQWVVPASTEVFATSDGGDHWSVTRSPLTLGSLSSFSSPNRGFTQGSGPVVAWKTVDGGRDWSPQALPPKLEVATSAQLGDPVSIIASSGPSLLMAAGSAGIYSSGDGGRTWSHILSSQWPVERLDLVNSQVAFAFADGELLRTTDGGQAWRPILEPPSGPALSVDFWSARAGVAETDGSYFVTYDAGLHWSALTLPSGWQAGPMNGDESPGAFCFSSDGTGWAAVSRRDDLAVLATTDGGRHWALALGPQVLPGAGLKRYQGSEVPGAAVQIAACNAQQAWVLIAQPVSLGNMQGVPDTFDLLVTEDLGQAWLDVLQGQSSSLVQRPRVPAPAGGPAQANEGFSEWPPQSALSPSPGALWLTSYNEDQGGEAFASTADGGQQWAQSYIAGGVLHQHEELPAYGWASSAASSARDGWALFSGPAPKHGRATSALYATTDGGANWVRVATFAAGTAA